MGKRGMSTATVHNFNSQLDFSNRTELDPIWERIYRKTFPGFLSMTSLREDGPHQKLGLDRVLVLGNSKTIFIDEKMRRKIRNDIALEYISVDTTNAPGWVCKPMTADYIAYGMRDGEDATTGVCFLLPVIQLQAAWSKNGEFWKSKYGKFPAQNATYRTWICPVPISVLYPAMGNCLRVSF